MNDLLIFNKSNIELFNESLVNLNKYVAPPDILLQINNNDNGADNYRRVMTLGNFSVVYGKAKAGKGQLLSMILPSIIDSKNTYNKFNSNYINPKKETVIYFDTEQSDYDAQEVYKKVYNRIEKKEKFAYSKLQEYDHNQRFEIIKDVIEHYDNEIKLIVIDGIIDICGEYNNEEMAMKLMHFLKKTTKIYDMHIIAVVHENAGKDNDQASGWLGRYLGQKCESLIQVAGSPTDKFIKTVRSKMQRGTMPFNDFDFSIDVYGNLTVVKNGDKIEENGLNLF